MVFSSLAVLLSALTFSSSLNYSTPRIVNGRYIEIVCDDDGLMSSDHKFNGSLTYSDSNNSFVNAPMFYFGYILGDENDKYFETWLNQDMYNNLYVSCDYYSNDEFGNEEEYFTPYLYDTNYVPQSMRYDLHQIATLTENDELELTFTIRLYLIPTDIYGAIGQSYEQGYSEGWNNGYRVGATSSDSEGYQNGYNVGYRNGYLEGINSSTAYNEGYMAGYNNGLSQSSADFGFMKLFTGIADTPILMLRSMFGFEIFGTSVLVVVLTLFTGIAVIHLLKRLIK